MKEIIHRLTRAIQPIATLRLIFSFGHQAIMEVPVLHNRPHG